MKFIDAAVMEYARLFLFLTALASLCSCGQKSPPPVVSSKAQVWQAQNQTVDRIVLAGGGTIEGKIVEETPDMVRIEWQNGIVGFTRGEIESIEKGAQPGSETNGVSVPVFESEEDKKAKWPEGADDLVYLKNGERIEGKIEKKEGTALTVRQPLKEGGAIVHEFDLSKIEKIELWPPRDEIGEGMQAYQKKLPQFQLIRRGHYHILSSEQDPADLNIFLRGLDQFYHDFLLHFFGVFDPDKAHEPLDVIIFGTREEFDQALQEIGFNLKSNPIGFYHFPAKKLVFYNAKTDSAVQASLAQTKAAQNQLKQLDKKLTAYGDAASAVRGQIQEEAGRAERYELQTMAEARNRTDRVIRHEGGHQLFHLLGITPIEIYQGGWLIEGLAVYCETTPIGDLHEQRLMELRFALERNELMPLEYLINFGKGTDFHKLDPLYAYLAYSESWALVYFLMQDKYRPQFLNYLKDISKQGPDFNAQKDRELLEKHLGKSLKDVEAEFAPLLKEWVSQYTNDKIYEDYRLRLVQAS